MNAMVGPAPTGDGSSEDAAVATDAAAADAELDADTLLDRIVEASLDEISAVQMRHDAEPAVTAEPPRDEAALFLDGATAFLGERSDWSELLDRLRARLLESVKAGAGAAASQPTNVDSSG
jgi:hypothetical protein